MQIDPKGLEAAIAAHETRQDPTKYATTVQDYGLQESARKRVQMSAAITAYLSAVSPPDNVAAGPASLNSGGWLPIETAPKDGTEILVFVRTDEGAEMQQVAAHDGDRLYPWAVSDGSNYHRDLFTHWRPLPAPPKAGD